MASQVLPHTSSSVCAATHGSSLESGPGQAIGRRRWNRGHICCSSFASEEKLETQDSYSRVFMTATRSSPCLQPWTTGRRKEAGTVLRSIECRLSFDRFPSSPPGRAHQTEWRERRRRDRPCHLLLAAAHSLAGSSVAGRERAGGTVAIDARFRPSGSGRCPPPGCCPPPEQPGASVYLASASPAHFSVGPCPLGWRRRPVAGPWACLTQRERAPAAEQREDPFGGNVVHPRRVGFELGLYRHMLVPLSRAGDAARA